MAAFNLRMASSVLHRKGVSDAALLKTLHALSTPDLSDLHDSIQNRIRINRQVAEDSEDGVVAVVESSQRHACAVHTVSSNLPEFWKFIDKLYEDNDGPFRWYVARVSDANVCSSGLYY